MVHKKVFQIFSKGFPQYKDVIGVWYPNGKNSIRVVKTSGKEMIFTFNSEKDWKLESVDSFVNAMKGGSGM